MDSLSKMKLIRLK